MFGLTRTQFGLTGLVVALILVIGASIAFGYNSITKSIDFFEGLGALGDLFGGLPSLISLLVFLLVLAIAVGLPIHWAHTDYSKNKTIYWVQFIFFVIALGTLLAFFGFRWVSVDDGSWFTLGVILIGLAIVTALTVLLAFISGPNGANKKVAQRTTTSSSRFATTKP